MRKIVIIGGLLVLALSACGQSGTPASSTAPTSTPPTALPTATPAAAPTAAPLPSAAAGAYPAPSDATAGAYPAPSGGDTSVRPPDALVAAAHDKLARYLGAAADTVKLQSANHKDWLDGALGCPQAGMAYPQIVTPGFLLFFTDGSQPYEVHTGRTDEQLILCQSKLAIDLNSAPPQSPTSVAEPSAATPAAAAPADIARQALADALDIKVAAVTVVASEETVWNDSSMGCPKPGLNYMQVITPGYKLTLAAGGKRYEYHTDRAHTVVRCDRG